MTKKEFCSLISKLKPCDEGLVRLRNSPGTLRQVLKRYASYKINYSSHSPQQCGRHRRAIDFDWLLHIVEMSIYHLGYDIRVLKKIMAELDRTLPNVQRQPRPY